MSSVVPVMLWLARLIGAEGGVEAEAAEAEAAAAAEEEETVHACAHAEKL